MSPRISYVQPSTVHGRRRCSPSSTAAPARARRGRRARRSAPTCRRCSGRSPIPGATCSRTASPIMPSRSCAASTCRARCCASSAATSARSRPPRPAIVEDDYRDLINFESSTRYSEKQKAALAYAETITWDLPTDRRGLGAAARALQRAGAGRDRLFRRAHHGPAALAAHARTSSTTRCSPAPMPRWRRASRPMDALKRLQSAGRLLGEEAGAAAGGGVVEPSP